MFTPKSRYQKPRFYSAESEFSGVKPREIGEAAGVVEHTVKSGDRLDILARNYYNDDRLWWRILDANPDILHADDLLVSAREGEIILIPKARD